MKHEIMEYEKAGSKSNRTWRVWLSPEEQKQFVKYAQSEGGPRNRLIAELGLKSGLRSFEIPQARPMDISIERVGEDTVPMLEIIEGKDTRGEGGKRRKTVLPNRDLFDFYADSNDLDPSDPFIPLTARRVQQIIKETARSLAEETRNSNWQKVSSHDLRRSWGHRLLVKQNMNPRALMSAGGWSEYDTMTDYLRKADAETIAQSYVEALS